MLVYLWYMSEILVCNQYLVIKNGIWYLNGIESHSNFLLSKITVCNLLYEKSGTWILNDPKKAVWNQIKNFFDVKWLNWLDHPSIVLFSDAPFVGAFCHDKLNQARWILYWSEHPAPVDAIEPDSLQCRNW